jgi:hypothetical protein
MATRTLPLEVVTVSALSLTLASDPRMGVMSDGPGEAVDDADVAAAAPTAAAESWAGGALSCLAHPERAWSEAKRVAKEMSAALEGLSEMGRMVTLLSYRFGKAMVAGNGESTRRRYVRGHDIDGGQQALTPSGCTFVRSVRNALLLE